MIDLSQFGIDQSSLEGAIGSAVVAQLAPILGGAEQDLKDFGLSVAKSALQAHLRGDAAWSDEVKAQVRGILEMSRIRSENVAWDMFEAITTTAVKAALNAAISMIPGGSAIPALASLISGAIK